jgi:hypothetical protein
MKIKTFVPKMRTIGSGSANRRRYSQRKTRHNFSYLFVIICIYNGEAMVPFSSKEKGKIPIPAQKTDHRLNQR